MAQRRVFRGLGVLWLAAAALAGESACKSVPTPIVTTPVVPTVERDTKVGWILRLEQQRVLRDSGLSPTATPIDLPRAQALKPASAPSLDAMALDVDPVIRRRAALAIGRIGASEGLPSLLAALKDPVDDVRASAAFAIGLLGAEAKDAVRPLEGLLADASLVVRGRAIEGLGLIGDASAVPAIFQVAKDCGAVIGSLGSDDEAFPKTPEIELCRLALFAFVRLQNYDAIAAITLNPQGQPVSRWWPAAYALQRINDKRAAPALLALTSTPGVDTAGFAFRGLAALKEPATVPAAATIAQERNVDVKVRIAAIRALGQIGGAAAATSLRGLLMGSGLSQNLIVEIVSALGAAGVPSSFDTLVDLVTDPSPAIRASAMAAASKVAPDSFLIVLAGLGRDADWSVRAALAGVLGTLPADRVTPAILDLLQDEDIRVHGPALEALAAVKAPVLTARLFAALEANDFVERSTAAKLIGDTRPEGGAPRLVTAYERGQSDAAYGARAAALEALAKYGGEEVKAVLRRGLGDREWAVRWRTAQLLRGLGDVAAMPERPAPLRQPTELFSSAGLLHPSYSPHAFIDVARGVIEVELDVVDSPMTSLNFIELARKGFFNGVSVHRLVPTFVMQTGDPRGDGEGGPGYAIPDELSTRPYVRGTMGMALDWRDTGGSQWFVTLSPQPHLDGKYTAFGHVVNGWDVLDRVSQWDVIERVRIWDGVEFK